MNQKKFDGFWNIHFIIYIFKSKQYKLISISFEYTSLIRDQQVTIGSQMWTSLNEASLGD